MAWLQRLHAVLLLLLLRGLRALPGVLLLLRQEGRVGSVQPIPSPRHDRFVVDMFQLWRIVINLELLIRFVVDMFQL